MNDEKIKIEKFLTKANEVGVEWLKNHLQKMLNDNPKKIDEIVNRMGITAFYWKNEPLWEHEYKELKGYPELQSFMSDFDSILRLTGCDMEFKHNASNNKKATE